MSTTEEDYSDYLSHLGSLMSICSLFSGFTFTAITIFLVQLRDASQIPAQLTLLFLSFFFHVFIFLLSWEAIMKTYYLKTPPLTRQLNIFNMAMFIGIGFWPMSIAIMFLLWSLPFLALASAAMTLGNFALFYFTVWKPMIKQRRAR